MIYLASDHGGYALKEKLKEWLKGRKIPHKDFGPASLDPEDDYPDYVLPLAAAVAKDNVKGIVICRNGQGAAIAANKTPGIRAAVCLDTHCATSSRNDDDANILSLPGDYLTLAQAENIVSNWLFTPFSHHARHVRRLAKLADFEQEIDKKRGTNA